jgi:CTP:molybdopterin cytidylyltransferase MocA
MTDGSSVILDNTCTAGTITLTGIGSVTDNSNGSTVIALADTPTVLHAATDAVIAAAKSSIEGLIVAFNILTGK